MSNFDKIVVIGAGVMGQGISSHIANSNRKVVLLDLKGLVSCSSTIDISRF